MFPDIWYIDKLPLARCTMIAPPTQHFEWRVKLKADIEERGMLSPILVMNRADKPYWVQHGHNRMEAVRTLGWEHVRALSFGIQPDDDLEPLKMTCRKECQAYLRDGAIEYNMIPNRDQFKINNCINPEYMKYPT